jgi:hypothetical protein
MLQRNFLSTVCGKAGRRCGKVYLIRRFQTGVQVHPDDPIWITHTEFKVDTIPNSASTLHNLPGLSANSSQCSMLTIIIPTYAHNIHVQLGAMVSMKELVQHMKGGISNAQLVEGLSCKIWSPQKVVRGDHLRIHGWSGGTICVYMDGPGGPFMSIHRWSPQDHLCLHKWSLPVRDGPPRGTRSSSDHCQDHHQ